MHSKGMAVAAVTIPACIIIGVTGTTHTHSLSLPPSLSLSLSLSLWNVLSPGDMALNYSLPASTSLDHITASSCIRPSVDGLYIDTLRALFIIPLGSLSCMQSCYYKIPCIQVSRYVYITALLPTCYLSAL